MFVRALVGCILLMAVSGPATAEPFRIAVPPLASLLEEDGSGVYQRLIDQALVPLDAEIEQHFYPYRRALRVFEEGEVDCVFSLTEVLLERHGEDEVIYSFPLGKFIFHIFTLADEPAIESVEALNGLSVATILGHEVYLKSVLGRDFQVEQVRSEAQAIRMLELNRLDAFIAALPDIQPFLGQLNYAPESPLLESFDRLNCHATERNLAFVDALSERLRTLKENGIYREEAGPLYVPFSHEEAGPSYADR